MATSAEILMGEAPAPESATLETEDGAELDAVESTEEVEAPEDSQETEGEEEEEEETPELPEAVREILKKNRQATRAAEARAIAAEKALAAKETPEGESAPEDTRFKDLYLKSAAKSALVEAGITTGTEKFLRMLDLASVEIDESGAIIGLDDQIADIKEDFADILAPKKKAVKVDGAGRRTAPVVPKSSAQILAEQLNR